MTTKYKERENLANLLKLKRIAKKITQKELAKNIGCNPSLISRYENGEYEPSGLQLIKILKALKISIKEL